MRRIYFRLKAGLFILFLYSGLYLSAQTTNYSYTEAFAPGFYTHNGTPYRSASGKPGPQYWQNSASYVIKANLDDKKDRISGSVEIHYTNNSPEDLDFLWLQLDQN